MALYRTTSADGVRRRWGGGVVLGAAGDDYWLEQPAGNLGKGGVYRGRNEAADGRRDQGLLREAGPLHREEPRAPRRQARRPALLQAAQGPRLLRVREDHAPRHLRREGPPVLAGRVLRQVHQDRKVQARRHRPRHPGGARQGAGGPCERKEKKKGGRGGEKGGPE
ncbi:MAG: hypothetical protein BJ554DRAFT_7482 [Olpidium bornovanus]|uniref:Uncharacterized protein n=1 Tax=Olpidium bornovanus TaxID=278681 RepID=A0A8H7ZWD8_9FUNG|nr:MAG: hypothetical protein BJ554DRAFT_7482 [Olpidium bornovanus]